MVTQTFHAKWVVAVANRIHPRPAAAPAGCLKTGLPADGPPIRPRPRESAPTVWRLVRRTDGDHRYNEVPPIDPELTG